MHWSLETRQSKSRTVLVLLGLSAVLALILVVFAGPTAGDALEPRTSDTLVAYAHAMPNQGWAPLTVYFSAFGSADPTSPIVRYEWDLDGDGRFETDATGDEGYAQAIYTRPRDFTVSLRVTNQRGEIAVASTQVSIRHPGSSSVDYWTVFDDTQVHHVEIRLTQENWDLMWEDVEAKVEVPADVLIFGELYRNVGFRMRGQFSMRMSGEKKPWKVNTDAYVDGQEIHNLHMLVFVNNFNDPTLLLEKLAYEMMHFAGVPSSHVTYVDFWIDISDDDQPATYFGVYTMVERVDRKFLANRFGQDNADGALYKASHAQRGPMDLAYYGDDITSYPRTNGEYAYGLMSDPEDHDYSDLLELIKVIDGTQYASSEEFAAALEQVMNVDSFLRSSAVTAALANWDSYPQTGNNYYLYHNPGTGLFEWIPWDLTWGDSIQYPLFERTEPTVAQFAPLHDMVFQVPRYRIIFAAYLDLLVREFFNGTNIRALSERYHNLIAPYLSLGDGDKAFYGESAIFSPEAFESSTEDLIRLAEMRSEWIAEYLSGSEWQLPAQAWQSSSGGQP
jgi:PKD repeat protein